MRNAMFAATMIVVSTTCALAAQATVNDYTQAQEDRAKSAIVRAGYRPETLAAVQDGNFFFTATKGSEFYQVTVAPSGKVFVSTGLPSQNTNSPPAG
ncbi:MAG TPA: hypothetical protein VN685_12225 [Rhizomicrobium sp.]|nr:hypothetical protein [Rhizomicrobium sp.]